jgi:hypothetical protein
MIPTPTKSKLTTEQKPASQVHEEITTDAKVGDYFKLPYQPCVKVISKIDSGDYITFIVQAGNNIPEQWDMLKPEVALSEQERDRIQAEAEREMSEIIHTTATQEFYSQHLGIDNWLTEPIGSNPNSIFGTFIEPSDQEIATFPVAENGYHDPNFDVMGGEF